MWDEDMTSTFTPDLATTVLLQQRHPGAVPPIWMAVEVRGGFVEVTEPPSEQNVLLAGTPLTVSGTVSRPPAGWIAQAAVQPRGEFPAAGEGSIRQQKDLKNPQFSMDFGDVPIDLAGSVTLTVTVYSGSGHILGMAARVFAVETQTTPSPTGGNGVTPIAAIWPELNAEDLAAEQARVDAGQDPWRLVAFQTAMHFAESVMGWDPAEIEGVDETGAAPGGLQTFSLRNRVIAKEAGPAVITTVLVTVQHLGRQGPTGIYSVTEAEINPSFMDVKCPSSQQDSVEVAPGLSQEVCGDLAWTPLGSKLEALFLNGDVGTPNLEPDEATNGSGEIPVAAHFDGSIAFTSSYGDQTTGVLLIEMTGQDGIVDALYARKLTIEHGPAPTVSPTP